MKKLKEETMEIKIKSLEQAKKYTPLVPTYAIRIFSGCPEENEDYGLLRYSKNYKVVRNYKFDDIDDPNFIDEDKKGFKIFDLEDARLIISDFEEKRKECLELMVHCRYGEGRSAALAAALNNIFVLGEDSQRLFALYPKLNQLVYEKMINLGVERGLNNLVKMRIQNL